MLRLIYCSQTTRPVSADDVAQILEASRRNNAPQAITGILCFNQDTFLQCLEGPRGVIDGVYAKIARDDRHTNVTMLSYKPIEQRLFAQWAMAYVSLPDAETKQLLKHHSLSHAFTPDRFTEEEALALVKDLGAHFAHASVVP